MLPLAPLGLESLFTEGISIQSVVVASAMYAMALGAVSKWRFCSISFLCLGGLLCSFIGFSMNPSTIEYEDIHKHQIEAGVGGGNATTPPDAQSRKLSNLNEAKTLQIEGRLKNIAIVTMILMGATHIVERYNRHIVDDEPSDLFYSG